MSMTGQIGLHSLTNAKPIFILEMVLMQNSIEITHPMGMNKGRNYQSVVTPGQLDWASTKTTPREADST